MFVPSLLAREHHVGGGDGLLIAILGREKAGAAEPGTALGVGRELGPRGGAGLGPDVLASEVIREALAELAAGVLAALSAVLHALGVPLFDVLEALLDLFLGARAVRVVVRAWAVLVVGLAGAVVVVVLAWAVLVVALAWAVVVVVVVLAWAVLVVALAGTVLVVARTARVARTVVRAGLVRVPVRMSPRMSSDRRCRVADERGADERHDSTLYGAIHGDCLRIDTRSWQRSCRCSR